MWDRFQLGRLVGLSALTRLLIRQTEICTHVGGNTFLVMTEPKLVFEEKGHPTIKIYDDRVSIKAIDYSQFRDFPFTKIKSLELFRPFDNSLLGCLVFFSRTHRSYRMQDDFVLRVLLNDGEHWDYAVTYKYTVEFRKFVENLSETIDKSKSEK